MPSWLSQEELDELSRSDEQLRPAAPARATLPGGFLSDDELADLATPSAPERVEPTLDSAGRVYVENKFGRLGTVESPDALGEGMQLAPRSRVERELQRAENESALGMLQTAGEQGLQGLTLGGYGAIAEAASPEYRQRMEARAEDNPGTAIAGQLVGSAAPVLFSGGTGALARGLAAAPAGLASRAALGTAEAVSARLGGGLMGRVGATAVGGAVEGGIAGAAAQLADAVPQFSTDPIEAAEHILAGAGEGALLGAATAGVIGGAYEGARALGSSALGRSAGKLISGAVPDLSPQGMREIAYESAAKAAIGRTNIAAVRAANKLEGGVRGVGQTLLEDGVVAKGDTVENILEKATAAGERYGQQIDGLVSQLDQAGAVPAASAIAAKIRADAIEPLLASPSTRARGKALAAHFGDLLTELDQGTGPFTSYRGIWQERRRLDDEIRAAFQSNSPVADGIKDVRRAFESGFSEIAEAQAGPEWRAAYKAAKTRYSHMRFASDESFKAIESKLSNRWFSPSDYGMAIGGGAIAGDPISGMAAGLANKAIRERGRSTVAAGMNWLAGLSEQAQRKTALVSLANSGQERIARAAANLVTATKRGAFAAEGAAIGKFTAEDLQGAMQEAAELKDPNSPTTQQLAQTVQQLEQANPGMGQAYANTAIARAKLIDSLVPKPPSNAVFAPRATLDPVTERKLNRAVEASFNRDRALERVAEGSHSEEDLLALKTVYPATWKRFQQQVMTEFQRLRKPPPLETRLRIAYATGLATDPTMEAGAIAGLQAVARMGDQQSAAEQQQEQKGQQVAQSFKPFDADDHFAGPVDARIDRR